MFLTIVRYILIVFGLVVLWASTSRSAMRYISDRRNVYAWWGIYPTNHGDLMGWSNLDFVEKLNKRPARETIKHALPTSTTSNTVLYLFGDSYCLEIPDTAFSGICAYNLINRYLVSSIHPDTTKHNILIIEFGERFIRGDFQNLRIFDYLEDTMRMKKEPANDHESQAVAYHPSFTDSLSLNCLFNKYINQNLQYNLFNYQFISPMFESKAVLNYYVFNRTSNSGVTISDNGNYLFFTPTVDATSNTSSYTSVSDEEITLLINNFNTIYDHYRQDGFSEVYLAIIPSPATIIQPRGYNNLIPRIQNDKRLLMKTIDIYTSFKNSEEDLYLHGDTHWNMTGKQIWVDAVNKKIAQCLN